MYALRNKQNQVIFAPETKNGRERLITIRRCHPNFKYCRIVPVLQLRKIEMFKLYDPNQ
jgi:hypothetical protein